MVRFPVSGGQQILPQSAATVNNSVFSRSRLGWQIYISAVSLLLFHVPLGAYKKSFEVGRRHIISKKIPLIFKTEAGFTAHAAMVVKFNHIMIP
jgi:hypothetical protein